MAELRNVVQENRDTGASSRRFVQRIGVFLFLWEVQPSWIIVQTKTISCLSSWRGETTQNWLQFWEILLTFAPSRNRDKNTDDFLAHYNRWSNFLGFGYHWKSQKSRPFFFPQYLVFNFSRFFFSSFVRFFFFSICFCGPFLYAYEHVEHLPQAQHGTAYSALHKSSKASIYMPVRARQGNE